MCVCVCVCVLLVILLHGSVCSPLLAPGVTAGLPHVFLQQQAVCRHLDLSLLGLGLCSLLDGMCSF